MRTNLHLRERSPPRIFFFKLFTYSCCSGVRVVSIDFTISSMVFLATVGSGTAPLALISLSVIGLTGRRVENARRTNDDGKATEELVPTRTLATKGARMAVVMRFLESLCIFLGIINFCNTFFLHVVVWNWWNCFELMREILWRFWQKALLPFLKISFLRI